MFPLPTKNTIFSQKQKKTNTNKQQKNKSKQNVEVIVNSLCIFFYLGASFFCAPFSLATEKKINVEKYSTFNFIN